MMEKNYSSCLCKAGSRTIFIVQTRNVTLSKLQVSEHQRESGKNPGSIDCTKLGICI